MSHYSVAVITYEDSFAEIEDLLEPYDENKEVEPYIYMTKEDLIEEAKESKRSCIERLNTYDAEQLIEVLTRPRYYDTRKLLDCDTDEDFFDYQKMWYGDYEEIDENGNIWSTYNNDSTWDWYSIGGRFSDKLYDKTRKCWCNTVKISDWDMDHEDEEQDMFKCTYAVITPDGEWHAPGKMGWFACSSETPEEFAEWRNKYKSEMRKVDKDWYITIVDCHI